jgi:2-polyprenyl-3-methyl-5-hydroxy-6-metoxy-1,4-benzoquinol methylase
LQDEISFPFDRLQVVNYMKARNYIKHNTKAHDLVCDKYEQIHGEIFNPIEQQRLHRQLEQSIKYIKTSSVPKEALDYGCGSGNFTKHLIDLGLFVISADITKNSRRYKRKIWPYSNGRSPENQRI